MRHDLLRVRERMVKEQIKSRGINDPRVLRAMSTVPRHLFVQEALQSQAYEDNPLPIGHGQTISQPYVVALMTELLEAGESMSVLEIGTGSGYQAAILAEMGVEVFTVERIRELHVAARERLLRMKYFRVRFKLDDGTLGWPENAPYDRIMVTAGGPEVPEPLLAQLADPGILVIPVGASRRSQELVVARKEGGRVFRENHGGVAFVDLVGRARLVGFAVATFLKKYKDNKRMIRTARAALEGPGPETWGRALLLALKGFCMGSADIVPGVSGGTVAFITGIYWDLVAAIRSFDLGFAARLARLDIRGALERVHLRFLIPLFFGILAAVVTMARVISHFLALYPVWVWSLFFGLIAASILVVGREAGLGKPSSWLSLILGAAAALDRGGAHPGGHARDPVLCLHLRGPGHLRHDPARHQRRLYPGAPGQVRIRDARLEESHGRRQPARDPGVLRGMRPGPGGVFPGAALRARPVAHPGRERAHRLHGRFHAQDLALEGGAGNPRGGRQAAGHSARRTCCPPAWDQDFFIAVGLMAVGFVAVLLLEYVSRRRGGGEQAGTDAAATSGDGAA